MIKVMLTDTNNTIADRDKITSTVWYSFTMIKTIYITV